METTEIAGKSPKVTKMEAGTYYWCACGRSADQPFCDGSHKVTSITPMEIVIEEPRTVAWCMCKQSKNKPFCDGSHSKL